MLITFCLFFQNLSWKFSIFWRRDFYLFSRVLYYFNRHFCLKKNGWIFDVLFKIDRYKIFLFIWTRKFWNAVHFIILIIAINLDGKYDIGAHEKSNLCYLMSLRYLIRSRAFTNWIFFCSERSIFLFELAIKTSV